MDDRRSLSVVRAVGLPVGGCHGDGCVVASGNACCASAVDNRQRPHGEAGPKSLPMYRSPDVLRWFVRRWTIEVTFEEVRRHLGVETQRQWTDLAILRTTPCLLGIFSMTTLMADRLASSGRLPIRQAAWYRKQQPTFSDALVGVRLHLWQTGNFLRSGPETETLKIPKALYHRLLSMIAYAT